MAGDAERSQSRWKKCFTCNFDCCSGEGCMNCRSCICDWYASCTSIIWWKKCLTCSLDCCSGEGAEMERSSCHHNRSTYGASPDENRALLGNDNERQQTTPQSTAAITQQPSLSRAGNENRRQETTPQSTAAITQQPSLSRAGNDNERQQTTPQSTAAITQQPSLSQAGNDNERQQETTPQSTAAITQQPSLSLAGNDNVRQQTTPQSTAAITQQPSLSLAGSNVGSEERTPRRTENPPEPPHTPAGDGDKPQEAPPQRTKSNQVRPQPAATSDSSYGKSSSFEDKVEKIRRAIKLTSGPMQKVKVGIFSRAAESEYQWLRAKLDSESCVKSVRSCYISNSGFGEFLENVSSCDFGILYHSLNRGRVNLTDVTDSLYDEELKEMSSRLGKKNVIVVIDDLKDIGEKRKREILEGQPSLGSLAADVFLFSEDEKKENI